MNLKAMALRDTGRWVSSRARAATLARWWPALLVLALAWVAWLNAPGACALEESAWREADAHLTRLMIRAHRAPTVSVRPLAVRQATASSAAPALQRQAFALHGGVADTELIRAKRDLESSLSELRMCRQGGAARAF